VQSQCIGDAQAAISSIHTVEVLASISAGVMFGMALRAFAMWMHDRLRPQ